MGVSLKVRFERNDDAMKSAFAFSWTYKDFEIRTLPSGRTGLPHLELIKYKENGACFVLAFYDWDKEGGQLRFVGNRPLEHIAEIDVSPIWKQLWLACQMLQDWYERERYED